MPSFLEEWILKHHHNPDGTMRPEYRARLLKRMSEAQVNQLERVAIQNVITQQQYAQWQASLPPESRKRPVQRRADMMRGLDREELMSQGFVEADDFYDPDYSG